MAAGQSPLTQFEIKPLIPIQIGDLDVSFTNASAFMVLAVVLASIFLIAGVKRNAAVPGRWQSMAELIYVFIGNLVRDTIGSEGRAYFPLIFTIFIFILFGNLLGMIPYGFTFTSHIIVTFVLAAVIFIGVTLLALYKHGFHFFSFFLPPGVPMWTAPLLVPIEIISYFVRPVSLSLRLAANMMAGHTLLKVFAGFVVLLGIAGVVPLVFVVLLTGLEIMIACLQAYVFTILTCLYINDALHLH
ncbi:MAG: F0F1 ATP synthase subunit A [Rhodospirillales bacterium]